MIQVKQDPDEVGKVVRFSREWMELRAKHVAGAILKWAELEDTMSNRMAVECAFTTAMVGTVFMIDSQGADFTPLKESPQYKDFHKEFEEPGDEAKSKPKHALPRSIEEIANAVAIFDLLLKEADLDREKEMASLHGTSILLWVMGQDNEFGEFINKSVNRLKSVG